ncbi:MAG: hypothetical protein RIG84_16115 [Roseovarius sp.]
MKHLLPALALCVSALPAFAEAPKIVGVDVEKVGMVWNIHVTLEHPDTGWDHFADAWRVMDAEGNLLGERVLMHPHVEEQPFTRSLSGIVLPDGTREVFVKARCSMHGWAEETMRVTLEP